jgi:hypothetical protein
MTKFPVLKNMLTKIVLSIINSIKSSKKPTKINFMGVFLSRSGTNQGFPLSLLPGSLRQCNKARKKK